MTTTKIDNVPWAQMQRLKYIERQLLWGRGLKTRMLVDTYGISRYQAIKDIKLYSEVYPSNLAPYDPAEKSYRPACAFTPKLISQDPVEVIRAGGFTCIEGSEVATVPLLHRRVIDGVIPSILAAIDHKSDVEAIYASASTPVGKRRRIHPKVIIYTGNRLHIRAYCYEHEEYRDFVLSRILTKPKHLKPKTLQIDDIDYYEKIEIELFVNPALSEEGQDLIKREYGLLENRTVSVRRCLVQYFLQANALPVSKKQLEESKNSPWSFPVISNYQDFW
ncbi:WYL domain-containing protein [Vibrio parahaemolyticus]|nr:WYL domain-containing protein [Vibrio parahaemolyticus]EGQ9495243.1 WYL domain-containing protein [Vibrio parahaemolyticus]EGQ9504607.1 WYL domain-containing protein [Vibrio parahaemolyticus]EGQ9809587.1 WYL domain-containing protein [Vibrio parahaemolyticus]EGR0041189.1 WYL domain-containing protein [Vibrio parahaemolyticus]